MKLGEAAANTGNMSQAAEHPPGHGPRVVALSCTSPVGRGRCAQRLSASCPFSAIQPGSLVCPSSSPLHTTGTPPQAAAIACARKMRPSAASTAAGGLLSRNRE